jgi:hypothetical protein
LEKHESEIRNALTLKDHFVQGADKRIWRIKNRFLEQQEKKKSKKKKKKETKEKEIIYVGVHIR